MRLDDVLSGAWAVGKGDVEVSDLAYDNRQVTPGSLFFCVPGFASDGHDFAADAVARGAAALVVERPLGLGVPEVAVPSVRAAMAAAAAAFYGDPTARLQTAGVTGTNGKTTSAFLLRALLEADRRQTGLLGTVKSVVGGVEHDVQRTTPEAIDLQRTFRDMLDGGDRACVMEVSSHALALHRADAIHFAAALFTNLTQDHLDFHPTMEDYFAVKRMLFVDLTPGAAIVNVDDRYGARLAAELPQAITFALRSDADYRVRGLETGPQGSQFQVQTPDGALDLRSPLRGEFNVYNVLSALATARALGVAADTCVEAIATAEQDPRGSIDRQASLDGPPYGVTDLLAGLLDRRLLRGDVARLPHLLQATAGGGDPQGAASAQPPDPPIQRQTIRQRSIGDPPRDRLGVWLRVTRQHLPERGDVRGKVHAGPVRAVEDRSR